jgi:hypothetical protein
MLCHNHTRIEKWVDQGLTVVKVGGLFGRGKGMCRNAPCTWATRHGLLTEPNATRTTAVNDRQELSV